MERRVKVEKMDDEPTLCSSSGGGDVLHQVVKEEIKCESDSDDDDIDIDKLFDWRSKCT